MKVLIIIPAYNEQESIYATITEITEKTDYDYVIVNDCSTDSTQEICEENGFNVINLPVNLGIGGAVQTGYIYALNHDYDIAVQVDGDGQHDPESLKLMVKKMCADNIDMVIGSRFILKQGFQSTIARQIGIKYFSGLIKKLTGTRITDPTSGLRMINKSLIREFARNYPYDYPEPESTTCALCKGYSVEEVPVIMRSRQGGVSSINPRKSIYYMFKVTIAIIIEKIRGGEL